MAFDPVYLKASAARALAGMVGPQVLAVDVTEMGTRLVVSAFATGPLGDTEHEDLDMATAEIIADFPDATGIELQVVEPVQTPPATDGVRVYVRP